MVLAGATLDLLFLGQQALELRIGLLHERSRRLLGVGLRRGLGAGFTGFGAGFTGFGSTSIPPAPES